VFSRHISFSTIARIGTVRSRHASIERVQTIEKIYFAFKRIETCAKKKTTKNKRLAATWSCFSNYVIRRRCEHFLRMPPPLKDNVVQTLFLACGCMCTIVVIVYRHEFVSYGDSPRPTNVFEPINDVFFPNRTVITSDEQT